MDARRVEAGLRDQAVAAVVRVRDDRIEAVEEADLGRARAGDALSRQDVVGGEDERAPPREEVRVQLGDREPLEVDEVGLARGRAVAEHVRDMRSDASGARAAMPVEDLPSLVAGRRRRLAVVKRAREELHLDAAGAEAGRERVVIGRRVRRWVDDVDLHLGTTIGTAASCCCAASVAVPWRECGLTDNVGVASRSRSASATPRAGRCCCAPLPPSGRAGGAGFRDRGAGARQRVGRRIRGGRPRARRGYRVDRDRRAAREGGQRQRADGALERALLPAAERGLGAPAGRRRARFTRRSRRIRGAACAVAVLRRPDGSVQPSAWRFPGVGDGARWRRSCCTGCLSSRARARACGGSTGGNPRRCWCSARSGRADRLDGHGVLRLLGRGRLPEAARRRGLAQRSTSRRRGRDPPRTALDRRRARAAGRRARARARPLHAKASSTRGGARGARPDRVELRSADARRARRAPADPAALPRATSRPRCGPRAGRACAKARRRATRGVL